MNTQTITTFLFSELNEKANEFALNKYREFGIPIPKRRIARILEIIAN